MFSYFYEDRDGDRLLVKAADDSAQNAAYIVSNNGIGVYVPAAEAPKAAQAILDAAGVKGVLLTDLPEVTYDGSYYWCDGTAMQGREAASFYEQATRYWAAAWKAVVANADEAKAEDAELKALEALKAKIEAKKAHDDLRTSPIALKALAIYNRAMIGRGPYKTWDDTNLGKGSPDDVVRAYIRRAEAEEVKEKEAAEKLAARRDELVRQHAKGVGGYYYNDLDVNGKYLVDRLRIALDEKRDAK